MQLQCRPGAVSIVKNEIGIPKSFCHHLEVFFTKIRDLIYNGAVVECFGKPLQMNLSAVWRSKKSGISKLTTVTPRPTMAKAKLELNNQIENNHNPEKGFVPRWEARVSWGVSFAVSFFLLLS